MPDGLVDPPGISSGSVATGARSIPKPLLIGGGVAVVAIVLILLKKKSAAAATASPSGVGPTSTSVIYPSSDSSGTEGNDIASYYNSLQTGIANSTGTTAQNIQAAQEALSSDIGAAAATNPPSAGVPTGFETTGGTSYASLLASGLNDNVYYETAAAPNTPLPVTYAVASGQTPPTSAPTQYLLGPNWSTGAPLAGV
jgi:hypothetical protein